MECMYYEKMEDDLVKCHLCPHYCLIKEGKLGICRVRKNVGGRLESLNYGKISSYAYDPIEKKPLYHFSPGSHILSIGSFGCNLACSFCQNWQIAHQQALTMEIRDDDLMLLGKSKGSIGIAYTYNEPSIFYEYVYHTARLAKKHGLKNASITNGYINPEPLSKLLPYMDAMNIDLKAFTQGFYNKICKGRLEPVKETIKLAAKSTHVEVTTLIIEGENSSQDEMRNLAQWLAGVDKSIPLHLSKYSPQYKMKTPETSYDVLLEARRIAREYLDYVYIGNVWGIDNNTYCPNCSSLLVNRFNGGEMSGIEDGKCLRCGEKINIL